MTDEKTPKVMKPQAKGTRKRGRPRKHTTIKPSQEEMQEIFPEYKPGVPVAGVKYGQPVYEDELHYFTKEQILYLETYIETLDKYEAAKAAGIRQERVWKCRHFQKAIADINYRVRLKWREKLATEDHLRLLQKFEEKYDQLSSEGKDKEAVSMAGNLLKGSETLMKAAGKFKKDDISDGTAISVNINIGGEAHISADQDTKTIDINTGE